MSVIPDAKLKVLDGGLGIVPANAFGVPAIIGTSSTGTANVVQAVGSADALKTLFGTGPLVEAAAHALDVAGGPVICLKVTSTTPGTAGAVTLTGTGLSVLTLTGSAPVDSYEAQVKIVTGGANPASNAITFQVSLDGGRTWSAVTALPSSGIYVVPGVGITLNFSAASLVAGDVYSFAATGPSYNTTDLGTAIDALLADSQEWFLLYVVGTPADATAMQGVFALIDAKLEAAANNYRFARGLMQAIDDTDANIKTAGASLTSRRVAIAAGFTRFLSAVSGLQRKMALATIACARAASVSPKEDLGRVATGPLPASVLGLLRDEFKTPNLDGEGYITARTHVGLPGFYITNPNVKSSSTSDFKYLQNGRVMDIAARAVRRGQLHYLNDDVRTEPLDSPTPGRILEQDALDIESYITEQMRADTTRRGYASDVSCVLDRSVNMLSTSSLKLAYRVLPLAYSKYIEGEISFTNPLLNA